ncbi:MAG: hypothetical protein ACR2QW_11500, partial [bacterium]
MSGNLLGGVAGSLLSRSGRSKSKKNAGFIVPKNIRTGNSSFNTRTGVADIDSSIREGQETFLSNIRGLRDTTGGAFDEFQNEIGGLRDEVGGLRSEFEGNQSAFREAALRPVTDSIANRRSQLNASLDRTKVKGSFADQTRNTFESGAAGLLSDTEAKIENDRINNLGNLLNMDADLLKTGLQSEQGRIQMLAGLEDSLRSVSSERFEQELALLGLPGQFIEGNAKAAGIRSNAEGLVREADSNLIGD